MIENSTPEPNQDIERIRKALSTLSEHFDTVHIFATRYMPDQSTDTFQFGTGNWYARFGQIKEWLIKREEETRQTVQRDGNEDDK